MIMGDVNNNIHNCTIDEWTIMLEFAYIDKKKTVGPLRRPNIKHF